MQPSEIQVRFRKNIKLSLRKDEIDEQVKILNTSADALQRLHSVNNSLYLLNAHISSKSSLKLASSLARVRNSADRLYTSISRSWSPSCHSAHEAKLFLENRIDKDSTSKYPSKKQKHTLSFHVIFASNPSLASDWLWHENEIKILEDEENQKEQIDTSSSQDDPSSQTSIKIRVSAPPL
jgi:hypothetical protein